MIFLRSILFFFIILFSCSNAQDKPYVYHLGFLYLGSDTLDVEDGGCTKLKVTFTKIQSDSLANKIQIIGSLSDISTGDFIKGSWGGKIFLGRIDTIKAKTWLGFVKTGLLVKKKVFQLDEQGEFKIEIPLDEKEFLIFTCDGCNVKVFSIADIKKVKQSGKM